MRTIIKSKLIKASKPHECCRCLTDIPKGTMAHREKHSFFYYDEDKGKNSCDSVIFYRCARCNYWKKQHEKRFAEFKKRCTHPEKHVHTQYSYMIGEAVMEPDYDECYLCGAVV